MTISSNLKKSMGVLLVVIMVVLLLPFFADSPAHGAAGKGYKYGKIDASESYENGKVELYCDYVELKGNTKAIKGINKHFKNNAKRFVKNNQMMAGRDWEEEINNYSEYYGYVKMFSKMDCKVTYKSKKIVSVRYTSHFYAGGVYNINVTGETYNIKTGKKLGVTKCVHKKYRKKSDKKFKAFRKAVGKKLSKKYKKSDSEVASNYKKKYNTVKKVKKQNFYLNKKGDVVCTFPTYDISYGANGTLKVTLKGRY